MTRGSLSGLSLLLAASLSGCGLLIDGAFLLSGKRFSKDERQSKRTAEVQTAFEHEVRAEQGQVWLACEDTERSMERVWTVRKDYQHRGGFYQAHWLPILLEGIIGGGLSIGLGAKCTEPGSTLSCTTLWGTVPLWVDVAYSAVRLFTIDPPKLVGKERLTAQAEPSATPNWRRTVACEPDARIIVGRSPEDPLATHFRVDAWGALNPGEQAQLVSALQRSEVHLMWAAGGQAPRAARLPRCEALRGLGRPCPTSSP